MYTIIMFEKHLGKFSWYIVLFLSLIYHNKNNNFKASSKVFVILKYFVKLLYTQILFFRELLVKV